MILGAAGAAMACHEIANTQDVVKKNEILVQEVGSLLGGVATASVGFYIVSMFTPVGWGLTLVIAASSAYSSLKLGQEAKQFYTKHLRHYDFTTVTGVNNLCR